MTAIQDSSASATVDTTTVSSSRNVRFTLRKKRNVSERSKKESSAVNLSSYNSDFLSGLFADVAKVNVLKELSIDLPSTSHESSVTKTCPPSMFDVSVSHVVPDPMNSPRPSKKSRISFTSSFQSRASCMNLTAQASSKNEVSTHENINSSPKQNSLAFQLDCLERKEPEQNRQKLRLQSRAAPASVSPSSKAKKDVAALAFPNLPSTVSDSSCESNNITGLTRERCLIQHGSAPEITASGNSGSKESFGWFVDLDVSEDSSIFNRSTTVDKPVATQDLAFQAPTAPKQATDHVQEEMEQAYAADTIDSVLGDFF